MESPDDNFCLYCDHEPSFFGNFVEWNGFDKVSDKVSDKELASSLSPCPYQIGEAKGRQAAGAPKGGHSAFRVPRSVHGERESELPVDAHLMITLMAPHPVYVASATEDLWADPKGEFLAGLHAGPVYALFGLKGVGIDVMPPPDSA